jgi:6-phosphogluconolactonase (cycloisomerase 2 family)
MPSLRRTLARLVAVTALLASLSPLVATEARAEAVGAVYVMTNDAKLNAVVAFNRGRNGVLVDAGTFSTVGRGTGTPLGSQGALILNDDATFVFAVNAGSNTIASFVVNDDGLGRIGTFNSRGVMPISLAVRGDVLYVLNAGGLANVAGFRVLEDGSLSSIAGSKQSLSTAAADPADVVFSPDGSTLVVTEQATRSIDVFPVDANGVAGPATTGVSNGIQPFGGAFDAAGHLLVAEAFNGSPGRSAVSSYAVSGTDLQTISASVGTTETSGGRVVLDQAAGYAYVADTGSGAVSSLAVAADGSLSLGAAQAGRLPRNSAPTDEALTLDGRYLYVLASGLGRIARFDAGGQQLTGLRMFTFLPESASGLAAW